MRAVLFRGSNLDVARVMGVFNSAVRVPRAKPLLGRPAVEGIATLSRRIGPTTICMAVPFSKIPMPFGRSITLY